MKAAVSAAPGEFISRSFTQSILIIKYHAKKIYTTPRTINGDLYYPAFAGYTIPVRPSGYAIPGYCTAKRAGNCHLSRS